MNRFFARPTPLTIAITAVAVIAALGVFLHRHIVLFLLLTLVLVVVAAVLVVWVFLRQIEAAKTEKAGKEIEQALDKQVEEEIQRSTFGQQAEVRNLKADWDGALAEFKRSSVGRRLGDKALAQHPMLLVIGPAGAGKTALIEESGLQSVLRDSTRRPRAVRGVGGSRSFSWWFTEQAILLDMAGKTLRQSQFEDNDDWIGFLRSLSKLRPERPINGIVFTVPMTVVAGADRGQLDALAETLRERAKDLSHHLAMEFPCYVVLTQCDRIAGFAETFAAFGEEPSTQPWGLTVEAKAAQATPAEELFDREYSGLVAALGDLRRVRLTRLPDEVQRMRALAFPGQLEALRGDLRQLVKQVFARGKDGGNGAYFRGLYFTSARVGSDTHDAVIAPAAEAIGVAPAAEAPSPEVARHAWFTQQLWTRVIFRDAHLASSNKAAVDREKQQRLLLVYGSAALFALGLLVFGLIGWNASAPVRAYKAAAVALPRSAGDARTPELLPRLGTLRAALAQLQRLHEHAGPGEWFGAYAGDRVLGAAERHYVDRVVGLLVEPRLPAIHDTLAADVAGGTSSFANLFWQYQAYTLLAAPDYQIAVEDSVTLGKVMVRMNAAEFARASGVTPEQLGDLMRGQMQMLAWIAGRGRAGAPFQRFGEHYDGPLATRAVAELQRRWGEAPRLYDDMIDDANRTTKALGVEDVLKQAHRGQKLLREAAPLPGAFTRMGWEQRVRPRLDVLLSMVDRDKVLQAQLGASLKDFSARFRGQYADAYVGAWSRWLGGLSAHRDPEDENQREALKREGRGGEIDAVVRRADAETAVPGAASPPLQIASRFAVVHGWLRRPSAPWPDRIRDRIPFIGSDQHRSPHQRFLALLAKAGKDPAGIASDAYSVGAANTVYNYNPDTVDAGTQSALRHVLLVLKPSSSDGSGLVGGGAAGGGAAGGGAAGGGAGGAFDMARFEADWGATIVPTFSTQVGSFYPFQPGAPEITLQAFAAYFGPGGNVDHMYQSYMKSFMDPNGRVGKAPAALPAGQLAWMAKAMRIQAAFFPGGAKDPSVQFDVKTNARNNSPAGLHVVAWHVGATDFTYEMGGEEPMAMEWSAATAAQGSRVNADLNGTPVEGPSSATQWGLFKVLDAAALSPVNGRHVMARWSFGGVTMRVEIMPRTEIHPFVEGFFRIGPPPPVAQP